MNGAALSCSATPNSAGGAPFLPNFCWGAPLLQGHLSFARDASSGGALPLRGTSLSCQRHPFSSYGAPLFAWAPLFCSERGTTLLLLGHSPSAGVALPLPQGRPSCAEYTPFLLVMRRPSSTGGAQQLLSAGAPICCWGVSRLPDIVIGAPISCLASPTSAEGSPSLINFCCGASLLLGRPSSAEGAPLLLRAPLSCRGLLSSAGAPPSLGRPSPAGGSLLLLGPLRCRGRPFSASGTHFLLWGFSFSLLGRLSAVRAPLFFLEWGRLSTFAGASLLFRGTPLLPGVPLLNRRHLFILVIRRPSSAGGAHLLLGRL